MRTTWTIVGCIVGVVGCGGGDPGESDATTGAASTAMTAMTATSTGASGTPTTTGADAAGTTLGPGTSETGELTTEGSTSAGTSEATTGDTGGVEPGAPCPPLAAPVGAVVMVTAEQAGELANIVAGAASGTTIVFADGTYDVSGVLMHVTTPGLTFRSASGDRDAVVLDSNYATGETFLVAASDTTIADMTLTRASFHPIHVTGSKTANTENVQIYNVKVIDPGQQAIKVNPSPEGFYSDDGGVVCSHLELTDIGRAQVKDNCYTGGVDAHSARGWVIRDNYIEGFWCAEGLSEHAVHMWVTCRDTVVERNVIVDCARGVGFGLGESGNGKTRDYGDDPCPGVVGYLGHIGGTIRNNMVFAGRAELFASQAGFDSGVALEQACDAQVYHNTIASLQPPFTGMEYRFANTRVEIRNNLVTHAIKQRDGAVAELAANLVDAPISHFVDAVAGDLHLAADSPAIGAGVPGLVDADFEGDPRDAAPDVGADERR